MNKINRDEIDFSKMTPEQIEQFEEIEKLVNCESLDVTTSMNIIIGAIEASFSEPIFNDLDRFFISKALTCFKGYVDRGENIVIETTSEGNPLKRMS